MDYTNFGEKHFGDFEHLQPEPIEGSEVYVTMSRKGDDVKIQYFKDAARTIPISEAEFEKIINEVKED